MQAKFEFIEEEGGLAMVTIGETDKLTNQIQFNGWLFERWFEARKTANVVENIQNSVIRSNVKVGFIFCLRYISDICNGMWDARKNG